MRCALFFNRTKPFASKPRDFSTDYFIVDLKISSRLGNTPRSIIFPDGSKCEVQDNDAIDAALAAYRPSNSNTFIYKLESRLLYVVLAIVFTVIFSWLMVVYGIPAIAEKAAYALPPEMDRSLGSGTLKALDETFFSESELEAETQQRISERFHSMAAKVENGHDFSIVFRKGGSIGANAFALPSGTIVLTDELVAMSENDDELASIIAHEIGHLVHRHSVRIVLQDSAIALLIATVTGDPFSSSSIVIALPTVLINAQYSQDFETEADNFAYNYMLSNNIPTQAFADIMLRISGGEDSSAMEKYLSTHPGTQERIARFRQTEIE